MPRPRHLLLTLALLGAVVASAAVAAVPADAATRLVVRGAGYGHGVGMSQYGAYGFALQGARHAAILRHYYTGTEIGRLGGGRSVRVLMQATGGTTGFTGAVRAGTRRVRPGTRYGVRARAGGALDLLSPRGRRLATVASPLRVTGAGSVVLRGAAQNATSDGAYRGALEFHARPGGVAAINVVSLEDYVAGVISRESPASWPLEALKAQAVAARTYAVTTSKGGDGFDHYADTRSQVYGGVAAETPTTSAAVAATRDEVVTHGGRPVVTYFFSTSGGRTEDVENTSLGRTPLPWLRSVSDPYDDVSPRHRWGPVRLTFRAAAAKLRGLVRGGFRGIEVLRRGRSPRVVAADVVGTRGRTRVDGATLRARLGLLDTWAYFTAISTEAAPAPDEPEAPLPPTGGTPPLSPTLAWLGARGVLAERPLSASVGAVVGELRGRIVPARAGRRVTVEHRGRGGWHGVGAAELGGDGTYRIAVTRAGAYRVRAGGIHGPVVRIP